MPYCGTIVSTFPARVPPPSLIRLSRPRFWLYETGTYVLGAAAAHASPDPTRFILFLLFAGYFLFPANLLIYGINDVYDYETDRNNPKKQGYEGLLEPKWHPYVVRNVVLWNLPFLVVLPWLTPPVVLALAAFAFCATFYSAPPIRAKARPFLDSLFSAGHYVATGVFGYLLVSGAGSPSWTMVIAGLAWCVAMHAYSAIPDIRSDSEAGLSTIATRLTAKPTIVLCAILYACAATLAWPVLGWVSVAGGSTYLAFMLLSWNRDEARLLRIYRFFPALNAAIGATITLLLLSRSFPFLP